MSDYVNELKKDLLEQFKGKKNIDSLIEVVGKQFDELYEFFEQLKLKRTLDAAEGAQLDGIGDIVALSRQEANALIYGNKSTTALDDDTYGKYLFFKIFKNTSNCTYNDIMKAVRMFWSGPPLRYSEDASKPATIIFDFDTEKDLADQISGINFVKAGGVGMLVRMHSTDSLPIYHGLSYWQSVTERYDCEPVKIDINVYLTDENDNILTDENDAMLIE